MVLRPTTQYFVPAADMQARIDQRLPSENLFPHGNPNSRKFYLSDVDLDDVRILSLKEKHGALGAIGRMANRLVDEGIVDASSLDAVKDKAIGIGRDALVVAIEGRPVYDLSNGTVKGEVASMALRELKVSSTGITAVLDPFGVVVKILAYALIGILVVCAALAFVATMFRSGGTGPSIGAGLSLLD